MPTPRISRPSAMGRAWRPAAPAARGCAGPATAPRCRLRCPAGGRRPRRAASAARRGRSGSESPTQIESKPTARARPARRNSPLRPPVHGLLTSGLQIANRHAPVLACGATADATCPAPGRPCRAARPTPSPRTRAGRQIRRARLVRKRPAAAAPRHGRGASLAAKKGPGSAGPFRSIGHAH
jgi:hypothetical protein